MSEGRTLSPSGLHRVSESDGVDRLRFPAGSLLVVGGIPGAGKSTLLRRIGVSAVVISPEAVAEKLSRRHHYTVPPASPEVSAVMRRQVVRALRRGENVIVDAPGLYPHLRAEYAVLAALEDRQAHFLLLDATPRQAREGQRARGFRVLGEQAMKRYGLLRLQLHSALRHHPEQIVCPGGGSRYDSLTVVSRAAAAQIRHIEFG